MGGTNNQKGRAEYGSSSNSKKNDGKSVALIIILTLIVSIGIIVLLWLKGDDIIEFMFDPKGKVEESNNEEEVEEVEEESTITLTEEELYDVYEDVHHMANTIIIPEDGKIIGYKDINRSSVKAAMEKLKGNDDYLYGELEKWLKLDFSNCVEVHNYVWDKFNGTIGRAESIDKEKVQQVINSFE